MLELVCICFAQRWLEWSTTGNWWTDDAAGPLQLPATDAERLGVRARESLSELAHAERQRGNPQPLTHLDRLRRDEQKILVARMGRQGDDARPVTEDEALLVLSVVDGLRSALAAPGATLDWTHATRLLALVLRERGLGSRR